MAVALDTTAHPTNAGNLVASHDLTGVAWQTITSPTFSTGSGPVIIRACINADGTAAPFTSGAVAWVGGTPTGWSAFSIWVDETDSLHEFGVQCWTAFSTATAVTTQSVAFTASTSSANQAAALQLLVENGCAGTEAAARGQTAGYIDQVGVSTLIRQAITPLSTGSSIAGIFCNSNTNSVVALSPNTTTSAFDAHHEGTAADTTAWGRMKLAGVFVNSVSGVAVTLGCTGAAAPNTDLFTSAIVTEIQPAGGGSSFTSTQTETASPTASFALGGIAGAASETESTSASASFAAATAGGAAQAETASPDSLFAGAMAITASQAESAQALDAYAFQLIVAAAQAETATPSVAFAATQAMGATFIASTSPSVSFDDGASPPRRIAGFPFWPWWYRLQPFNRKRIM